MEKVYTGLKYLVILLPLLLAACSEIDSKATPPTRLDPQIVGGTPATAGAYPFMVQLRWTGSREPDDHSCGGSLLERTWVLTAGHCVQDSAGNYTVVLGEHTRRVNEGVEQVIGVRRIVPGPGDIALLELATPATLNARVGLTELGDLPGVGSALRVIGWGRVSEGGPTSNTLLQVDVPLVPDADCETAYPGFDTGFQFCAGFEAGGADSCTHDSGGPVFDRNQRQVGLVSWGRGCARPNAYGVYADVTEAATWIESVVNPPAPISRVTFRVSPQGLQHSLRISGNGETYSAYDGRTLTLEPGSYTVSGNGYDTFAAQPYVAEDQPFSVRAGEESVNITVYMRPN